MCDERDKRSESKNGKKVGFQTVHLKTEDDEKQWSVETLQVE